MPELPEVEAYRLLLAGAVGRRVAAVDAPDAWYLKGGLDAGALVAAVVGRHLAGARRRGKLLLVDLSPAPGLPAVLGLRFGMTGTLLVDGRDAGPLLYAPARREPRWDRLVLHLADGGDVRVSDPRRLGGVVLDPDLSALGPDALTVRLAELAAGLAGSAAPLKARLLDQAVVAGIGNLAGDELLWRAALAPARPAGSLDGGELRRLHRAVGTTLRLLIRRGGSHTGDLMPARRPGGTCPADGTPLRRSTVGGRTTWWCPAHQR